MKRRVFICYGREDVAAANRIYRDLTETGYEPWLDTQSLIPGQKWKHAIINAIRSSRYFIALLSSHSVSRRGFVNKEIREALDVLAEFPDEQHFLIPARLDDCTPSDQRLSELQRVDMFPLWDEGIRQIRKALEIAEPKGTKEIDWSRQVAFVLLNSSALVSATEAIAKLPYVGSVRVLYGEADLLVTLEGPIQKLSGTIVALKEVGGVFNVHAYLAADEASLAR